MFVSSRVTNSLLHRAFLRSAGSLRASTVCSEGELPLCTPSFFAHQLAVMLVFCACVFLCFCYLVFALPNTYLPTYLLDLPSVCRAVRIAEHTALHQHHTSAFAVRSALRCFAAHYHVAEHYSLVYGVVSFVGQVGGQHAVKEWLCVCVCVFFFFLPWFFFFFLRVFGRTGVPSV
jgi:hypothetical protein